MSVPWYLMAKGKGGGGYKTASGPIVSINDALAAPLRSLRVGIDPVQDLHGYDSPWPGGGGKNKFDPQYFTGDVDTIYLNFHGARNVATAHGTHVKANTTYTCTIQLPATPSASWGIYGCYANDSTTVITFSANGIDNPRTFSFTPTEDTDVIMWAYMSGSGNTWSNQGVTSIDNVRVQIEQGPTATTYAPYSNICPISGWSAANLWRTGKNLCSISSWSGHSGLAGTLDTPIPPNTTFTMSGSFTRDGAATNGCAILFGFSDGTDSGWTSLTVNSGERKSATKTFPKEIVSVKYYASNVGWSDSQNYTLTAEDFQLELSSTPTPYTPYTGNQYTIQLGQTVYGGTLDVTNGVLRVTHQLWTKNTANMDNADNTPGWRNSGIKELIGSDVNAEFLNQIMNIGKYWSANTNGSNDILFLRTARYNKTQTEWIALAIDVQIAVKLATPITIPLTPQEISTLQGQNTLWADTGDSTVEYLSAGGANADLMKLAVAFMGRE